MEWYSILLNPYLFAIHNRLPI